MLRIHKWRYSNWLVWSLVVFAIAVAAKGIISAPVDVATETFKTITGHEWDYNIWRLIGMGDALSQGMPGRWLYSFSHGWGYPLFHYTGPLPYTVGGLLYSLGFDANAALNFCWLSVYAGAGVAMFWATIPIFGRWGALLASVCYLLAPYHLVDTYVRTNLVETTAFVFPPLVLRALWFHRRGTSAVVLGALGVAFIPLTHLLSTYLIGLGLIVFTLVCTLLLPANQRRSFFVVSGAVGATGLALSAFFWLPALGDVGAVKGFEAMTDGFYSYTNHFVYPFQLFSHQWSYGGSEVGPKDYMSFSLGPVIAVLACLAAALAVVAFVAAVKQPSARSIHNRTLASFVIAAFIAAVVMAFLTLGWSEFLWKIIPKLEVAQFPWRFLFPASFFLTISAGGLPRLAAVVFRLAALNSKRLPRRWLPPLVGLVCSALVVFVHWDFARAGGYDSVRHERLLAENYLQDGVWTTNQLEFLPVESTAIPYDGTEPQQVAQFLGDNDRIAYAELGHGRAKIKLKTGRSGTVLLNQHWHPAWRASVDGKIAKTYPLTAHPYGPVAVDVDEGAYDIEFKYGFTGIGYIGLMLSLLTVVGGLSFLYWRREYQAVHLAKWPGVLLLGVLTFYWSSSFTDTRSSSEWVAAIDKVVDQADVASHRRKGTAWDASGNIIIPGNGVLIRLSETLHNEYLELSTDSNDRYLIAYLQDGKLDDVGSIDPDSSTGGLAIHKLRVPGEVVKHGFDEVAIIPTYGDGSFSLGHLRAINASDIKPRDRQPQFSGVRLIPLHIVETRKHSGAEWNEQGNIVMDESGVTIELGKVVHARKLEVSTDSNDIYLLRLLRNGSLVGSLAVPIPKGQHNGLGIQRLNIADEAREAGFDRVAVLPLFGDHRYSLGHLRLIE